MPLALIVGAGIGGLAAGLALRRAGWDVRIFERFTTPREVGFAVGLAPNAIRALRELGLGDVILPHAFPFDDTTEASAEIRHADGRLMRRFSGSLQHLGGADLPRIIMRPVLHHALLDAVGCARVECDHDAVGFRADGRGVAVEFRNGVTADGDILVGADGVASAIRPHLHPREAPPRPSGYFALRGWSDAMELLDGVHATWYFGPGLEGAVVQAGRRDIYWFLSMLADDVRSMPQDVEQVRERFMAGLHDRYRRVAFSSAPAHLRLDELFAREPLNEWGSGPVTLLGDAAHPMLPHTGQGAAQALEDAAAMGRVMRESTDIVAGLRRYERVRSRRANTVVRSGPRIARMTTTRSRARAALRNTAIRLMPFGLIVRGLTAARVAHAHASAG